MSFPRLCLRLLPVLLAACGLAVSVIPASAAPGVTVTGSPLSVTEGGATDTYTVVLNELPTGDVTITLTPGTQITVGSSTLTFTTANWNAPQTVTVTAVNDTVVEGVHSATITHSASGGGYTGVTIAGVTVNITDNDNPTVTVTGSPLSVTEGGATDIYTVVLGAQPSAAVTITLTFGTQITVGGSTLTFTTANWNAPQTVTVTAVNDTVVEGVHSATITHSASGGGYTGVTIAGVTVNITDNDNPTVTVTGSPLSVTEGGATDTYTVVLGAQPSAAVTITLTFGTQITVGSSTLTFTTANWNAPQTVTVTAVNDTVVEGVHSATITHSASGGGYTGVTIAGITVNITDNDNPTVTVTGSPLSVTEGGATDTYTVVLTAQPSADVTITLTSGAQVNVGSTTFTFTTANWNTPQTVTVTAVNDAVVEGAHSDSITHAASGGGYTGVSINNVIVNITDDDNPSVTVTGSPLSVTEGGATDTYTVVLDAQPSSGVTITLTPGAQVTVDDTTLVFTPANWNIPQTVTVTAFDDAVVEGAHSANITHAATGGGYTGVSINNVTVNITDDDPPSVTVSGSPLSVTEGGAGVTYTVELGAQPSGNVRIDLTTSGQVSVSPNQLNFNGGNWDSAQLVTVTAVDDLVVEGTHADTISHAVATGPYAGVTIDNVAVTITDNDTGSVIITQSDGTTDVIEEGETSDSYTVVLGAQPAVDVTITLTYDAEITVSTDELTFTNGNWNTAQTITVTAVDDFIDENPFVSDIHTSTITHNVAGDAYTGVNATNVVVNVEDNDTAGLSVISLPPDGNIIYEGGATDGFDISLTSQPLADVVLEVVETTDFTAAPATLTFTPGNWNIYQTVALAAVDDALLEGTEVQSFNLAAFSEPGYNGIFVGIDLTIVDNEVTVQAEVGDGVSVAEGSTVSDSYTLALNDNPPQPVSTTVSSSQCLVSVNDIAFNPSEPITFTGTTPVTIFVRAIDDDIAEGTHTCTLSHTPTTSADPSYSGLLVQNVVGSVADNDNAGITVTESGGSTALTEGGTTDTFTVVLTSQPTDTVTVAVQTDSDIQPSPVGLTFNTANWNTPQQVTLSAVDDLIVEGAHTSIITLVFDSTDPNYDEQTREVTASVTDNDTAAITFTDQTPSDLEAAGTVVRTVTITYSATGTGDFGLAAALILPLNAADGTADSGDYTFNTPSITFGTTAAQGSRQDYTYTLIDDLISEPDETFTVALGTPSSASTAMLANITASDSLVHTITNDDLATIVVVESGGSTTVTEGGMTDNYEVSLNTLPTGTVTVTITATEVTTTPTTLTFTPSDWDQPQQVIVTAIDDLLSEGAHTGTIIHSASGGGYDGTTLDVTVNVIDNDSREVSVLPAAVNVLEGGNTDQYTLTLTSQPTADVTLNLTTSQVTVSPASVTFTTANWNTPQTITVTAIDDAVVEGQHQTLIQHGISGGGYDGVSVQNVTVTINDNDAAGVVVTTLDNRAVEGGKDATYTIQLTSQPTDDVVVTINNPSTRLSSPISLTITPALWDSPQTVNVQAVNNGIYDGLERITLTHTVSSADLIYDGFSATDMLIRAYDGVMELAVNGGFEDEGETDLLAANWNGVNLVNTDNRDLRVCNSIDDPTVARSGECAFQFRSGATPASPRRLIQRVTSTGWGAANDELTLTAYFSGVNFPAEAKMVLTVIYTDGTTATINSNIPTGTYDYRARTRTLTLTKPVQRVVIKFNIAKRTGRLRIDDVTLTLTPRAVSFTNPLISLPPAP
ncbi:MAG: hypothetical protein MUF38_01815 [Anaerolineae bacterium]|nr:hypothetical protein [Anaerolineae bacterium]